MRFPSNANRENLAARHRAGGLRYARAISARIYRQRRSRTPAGYYSPGTVGSFERFIGILIEHFAGEFPIWLTPVQAVVIPITDAQRNMVKSIFESLNKADIRVDFDDRNEKVGYKIRDWELKKVRTCL